MLKLNLVKQYIKERINAILLLSALIWRVIAPIYLMVIDGFSIYGVFWHSCYLLFFVFFHVLSI